MLLFGKNEDLGPRKMYVISENSLLTSVRGQITVIQILIYFNEVLHYSAWIHNYFDGYLY